MSDDKPTPRQPDDDDRRRPADSEETRAEASAEETPSGRPDTEPETVPETAPTTAPVTRVRAELPAEAPADRADPAEPAGGPETDAAEGRPAEPAPRSGRQHLIAAVWPPRVTRPQLIVAVLLFVLGLGLAIQVRSTSEDSPLRGARQEDLVRILDELDDRTERLEDEKERLEDQRRELENSSDQAEEARKQTRQKERQLGVLAGTVAATGPGLHITINGPQGAIEADKLLDTIQELRAAGAEAIEINDARVVADTYFADSGAGVRIDGRKVSPPYRFEVIGEPKDLEPALNIPGGVVQTLEEEQASVLVSPSEEITVDALRSADRPDYARSSS